MTIIRFGFGFDQCNTAIVKISKSSETFDHYNINSVTANKISKAFILRHQMS